MRNSKMRTTAARHWIVTAAITAPIVVGTVCQVGCASMGPKSMFASKDDAGVEKKSLASKMPWAKKDDTPVPYPNPSRMAVTWTPDTLVQTGRTPTRGFGGRVYFYDEKAHAVPVEGTLVIHAFNENAEDERERSKRFEFTPEQFTRHYSQSDLGASYSIWVPWDAVGGKQERVALVASFQPKSEKSQQIQGVSSMVVLPGQKTDQQIANFEASLSPQYMAWKEASLASTPPTSNLTTTTISRGRSRTTPKINVGKQLDTMLAKDKSTPSLDIPMSPRRALQPQTESSKVMATSGFTPLPQQ